MTRLSALVLMCTIMLSCSTFTTSTELHKSSSIKSMKKAGLIIRTQQHSNPTKKNMHIAVSSWIEGYSQKSKVSLIPPSNTSLDSFENSYDKLCQRSINNRFLKYKSIGAIKLFIRKNRAALNELMTTKEYSGLVIYEVESSYSGAMQFGEFESLVLILDNNLEIVYIDQQKNNYEIDDIDLKGVEKHLLDKISERLTTTLANLNLLKQN